MSPHADLVAERAAQSVERISPVERLAPIDAFDQRMMKTVLGLAQRELGRTWPNPVVGCVLVRPGALGGGGLMLWGEVGHSPAGVLTPKPKRCGVLEPQRVAQLHMSP
ncbi:hypothetical protein CCP2SC5_1410003 [Azospirillaceae bacterium]